MPRDWSVEVGDDEVYHIVRLHRKPELAEGWRLNLSAFPLKRAPHAEWNNKIERAKLFLP